MSTSIKEGRAIIAASANDQVFYNKVQILNRDLSIQVISLFAETLQKERDATYEKKSAKYESIIAAQSAGDAASLAIANLKPPHVFPKGISILEALAATGLRSIRYLKEIPNVRHITINDLDITATNAIQNNLLANGISANDIQYNPSNTTNIINTTKVRVNTGDAAMLMYHHREPLTQFDVIDLDPYGSAAPFIDSAVQAVADGGLLCVTCTDMSVFCGNYPEKCFALYGSMPIKAKYGHEQALRILLNHIETTANKYKRHIVPWVSMSIDYYMRVWVRIHESPAEVKLSSLKRGMIFQSAQCNLFHIQPLGQFPLYSKGDIKYPPNPSFLSPEVAVHVCPETGGRMKMGGPVSNKYE